MTELETRYQRVAREQRERREKREAAQRRSIAGGRWRSSPHKPTCQPDWHREADRIDGYDRDDLGESPDF
jgi:hypothetical protein